MGIVDIMPVVTGRVRDRSVSVSRDTGCSGVSKLTNVIKINIWIYASH